MMAEDCKNSGREVDYVKGWHEGTIDKKEKDGEVVINH
jgi:hypothetical protein